MERRLGHSPRTRTAIWIVMAAAASVALSSCGGRFSDYDPSAGLKKEDYETLLNRRSPEQSTQMEEPPIPDFQPVLAAPSAPELADVRRVSISVTDATPLRDILIELEHFRINSAYILSL